MMTRFFMGTFGKHKISYRAYWQRDILTMSNKLIEYMKLHLISLEQDLEENPMSLHVGDIEGQIYATRHLLSVAEDMIEA